MIDENEYNEFVNSVANFVSTCMHLWQQQFEMNKVLQRQITEHLEIIQEYRNILKLFHGLHQGHKSFLIDHEKRILDIERALRSDAIFEGPVCPKAN